MKTLTLILSLFFAFSLQAQISYNPARKLIYVRTCTVAHKKPPLSQLPAGTWGYNSADSTVYKSDSGQVVAFARLYAYSGVKKSVHAAPDDAVTYNFSSTKKMYYLLYDSIGGNMPVIADFPTSIYQCINLKDSSWYDKYGGIVRLAKVFFPIASELKIEEYIPPPPTLSTRIYISASGSDASTNPHNPSTPYKSISKANAVFSSLSTNDSILFKAGEVFAGSIIVSRSNIYIGSYGNGKAIISGFQTVAGWTNLGGNVWESSATNCKSTLNMVTINGAIAQLGRYPNKSFLTYESFTGTSSITDNQLTDSPNWTGAEVVIRTSSYNAVRQRITNQNSGTITYSGGSTTPTANYGYFIQKDPRTLDTLGEWYLNPTTKKIQMYFSNNNPNAYTVKASTIDTLIYCKDKSYVTINDLSFEGPNVLGIYIYRGTNVIVSSCDMNLSGGLGIYSIGNTNFRMQQCNITNSLHTGAQIGGLNSVVSHNTIRKSGLIIGRNLTSGGFHGLEAIDVAGNIVEYNTIDSSGRDGLYMRGINSISRYNLITYFGLTLDDCGGIYTSGTAMTGRKIYGNIILYGIGNRAGASNNTSSCEGIYLDEPITGVEVTGNTVAHCGSSGLRYHNAYNIVARENLLYDNKYNIGIIKSNINAGYSRNLKINNNISVCKTADQFAFRIYNYIVDNPLAFGTADSNYYCRPVDDNLTIRTIVPGSTLNYSLSTWQAASAQDSNSHKSPSAATQFLFDYNATETNKTVTGLSGWKSLGNASVTSYTLLPYKSIILIK